MMETNTSIAGNQYPQIVWREGKKFLWNPIHRKALKNLPEERVRLRVLEYLTRGGWSRHRISTEEAIDLPQKETAMRTDLICYTDEFNPHLLVECKAESISLSEKTAEQIARYNRGISAPYLLMTNGRTDYWYALNRGEPVQRLSAPPSTIPEKALPNPDLAYWQQRGFAGSDPHPSMRPWLNTILQHFLLSEDHTVRHLSFNSAPGDVDLNNYYTIFPFSDHRIAAGFTSTAFGSSRLTAILNRQGQNEALLQVNLDFLFDEREPNASLYWSGGKKNVAVNSYIDLTSRSLQPQEIGASLSRAILDVTEPKA